MTMRNAHFTVSLWLTVTSLIGNCPQTKMAAFRSTLDRWTWNVCVRAVLKDQPFCVYQSWCGGLNYYFIIYYFLTFEETQQSSFWRIKKNPRTNWLTRHAHLVAWEVVPPCGHYENYCFTPICPFAVRRSQRISRSDESADFVTPLSRRQCGKKEDGVTDDPFCGSCEWKSHQMCHGLMDKTMRIGMEEVFLMGALMRKDAVGGHTFNQMSPKSRSSDPLLVFFCARKAWKYPA